jgi:chromosome segregation ATPase
LITEKRLLEIKKQAEDGKQNYIKAEAALTEVNRNIDTFKQELRDLGVDPDNAEQDLKAREDKIMELYNQAVSLLPEQQRLV